MGNVIFWDFDGTVVYSEHLWSSSVYEALKYPDSKYYKIGDSINADIVGGNSAGMITVLVHKGYSEKACYCFDELKEVLGLFE